MVAEHIEALWQPLQGGCRDMNNAAAVIQQPYKSSMVSHFS
jgi:hypothetical protein